MATLNRKIRTERILTCGSCGRSCTVPMNLVGPTRCPTCRKRSRVHKTTPDEKRATKIENPRG